VLILFLGAGALEKIPIGMYLPFDKLVTVNGILCPRVDNPKTTVVTPPTVLYWTVLAVVAVQVTAPPAAFQVIVPAL
jgi:hypothetical protein